MSKKDSDETDQLRQALNHLTNIIHNEWDDLSKRRLSIDDRDKLFSDLKAAGNQIRQLFERIKNH